MSADFKPIAIKLIMEHFIKENQFLYKFYV